MRNGSRIVLEQRREGSHPLMDRLSGERTFFLAGLSFPRTLVWVLFDGSTFPPKSSKVLFKVTTRKWVSMDRTWLELHFFATFEFDGLIQCPPSAPHPVITHSILSQNSTGKFYENVARPTIPSSPWQVLQGMSNGCRKKSYSVLEFGFRVESNGIIISNLWS